MSRIAKQPISLPKGVELKIDGNVVSVKGPKGNMQMALHESVNIKADGDDFVVGAANDADLSMAGTMRSLVGNMVAGVSEGFERKLELVGVGYRASMQGTTLNLTLGFSHPVNFTPPEGITIETPSQTEIVIRGSDKQKVGQVAANIRAYRPPEPYKGKGVRYSGERIMMKEAKKA